MPKKEIITWKKNYLEVLKQGQDIIHLGLRDFFLEFPEVCELELEGLAWPFEVLDVHDDENRIVDQGHFRFGRLSYATICNRRSTKKDYMKHHESLMKKLEPLYDILQFLPTRESKITIYREKCLEKVTETQSTLESTNQIDKGPPGNPVAFD